MVTTRMAGATAYDNIPFPGLAQPASHPDNLAAAATLWGMRPADVERCTVLELGCGDGANLIPIAHSLPNCRAVGIDLAPSGIEKGAAVAEAIGLRNLAFRTADLTALPDDLGGPFDYIIAHGVYSWVPQVVRDALLASCARLLAPGGVAYVSYNAYPAHHSRQMAREMMLYAADRKADPFERIRTARQVLTTLATARPEGDIYGTLLREELKRHRSMPDQILFHDDLEPDNAPVYFHQFVEHARGHGLQYLCESEYSETAAGVVRDPRMATALAELMAVAGYSGDDPGGTPGDDERRAIDREQFADFVRGRAFRRTLLCRAGIPVQRTADPRQMYQLRIAGNLAPAGDAPGGGGERFRHDKGITLTTNNPLARAALRRLGRIWPRSEPFRDLLAAVTAEAGPGVARRDGTREDPPLALAEALLAIHAGGVIDLRTLEPALAPDVSERPIASTLARYQARCGSEVVTNLLGSLVRLEGTLPRELLVRLDGTRDHEMLIRDLAHLVATGAIPPAEIGGNTSPGRAAEVIRAGWGGKLELLTRKGLLTAS